MVFFIHFTCFQSDIEINIRIDKLANCYSYSIAKEEEKEMSLVVRIVECICER